MTLLNKHEAVYLVAFYVLPQREELSHVAQYKLTEYLLGIHNKEFKTWATESVLSRRLAKKTKGV